MTRSSAAKRPVHTALTHAPREIWAMCVMWITSRIDGARHHPKGDAHG